RQDKLEGRYREIEHLKSAVQQLVVTGLVMDKSAIQDPEDALAMLTMDELKLLARRIGIMEKMSGKQRGTIKATTAQNKKAGRKASTAETLTGTKRQLPLDFSSHAVRPHSKKASQENPTSAHNQIDVQRHQIIHSNSSSSASSAFLTSTFLSEPPVIRVNLTASKPCDRLVGYGSGPNYVFETETLTGVSNTLLEETNDLSSPEDDENDSGAVVLRAIASKASHPNNEQDCEDTETPSILDQTDTMVDDLLQTKSESQDEDRNLDTLLSPPFRWKTVYVAAFELALDTVLPEEAFLFTDEEHTIIETYRALPGIKQLRICYVL
ncbi:hypothetical protein BX616_007660, partial [Lobosporangium transversale]